MKRTTVVILGAGMSGLCMAIKLRQAGITDLVILEKSQGVGGTWHDNTYPGACCDVASVLYSYSFEPNPDWSRAYSPQAEIKGYFEHCAQKYELLPSIQFGAEVAAAKYQPKQGGWLVSLAAGEQIFTRILVSGLGQLNLPHTPDFPGQKNFIGASFHSARWNHNVDLRGKRVAVIGNAASAIQFIPPVAREAEQVYVYQRSANYIVQRGDREYRETEQRLFRDRPWVQKLHRLRWFLRQELLMYGAMLVGTLRRKFIGKGARKYLEDEIGDPDLRATLTPDYPLGCKRVLVSDDYYQALESEAIELVTSPIEGIAEAGVVSADGASRPVDVIIYATGFRATEFLSPLDMQGDQGQGLNQVWADGAEAHRGVALAGFPNFFMLYGPNTNLGHNSIIFMLEAQVRYVIQCVEKILAHDIALQPTLEAQQRYNEKLQRDLAATVWGESCGSWYKNASGKIINNWPHTATRFALEMRAVDFSEYSMSVADSA